MMPDKPPTDEHVPLKPEWMPDYLEHVALSANKYQADDLRDIAEYIRTTLNRGTKR